MLRYSALRFTALAAAVTLFLLAADHVASLRTTVIIDASAAENWPCSAGTIRHCQEYMMEEAVRRGGAGSAIVDGGIIPWATRLEVDLEMCCCKLRQMDVAEEGNAACSGVEEAMRRLVAEQKQRGDVIMGEEELKNAWEVAEELPRKCGVLNSPSKCRFNSGPLIMMTPSARM